jgi:hypothetical protein
MHHGHLDLGELDHLVRIVRRRRWELPLPTDTALRRDLEDLRRHQQGLAMAGVPELGPRFTLGTRAGGPFRIPRIGRGGTIGGAGGLGQARFERGDPRGLLLDDGKQLDDQLVHQEQCLFPTGGLQRKTYW